MKKFSWLLFLFISVTGVSQTLKGVVSDEKNRPVEFMYVINQRTQNHAHTNFKGVFEMEGLKVGDTLVFNKMGFETKQIIYKNNKVNITVKPNTIDLDQIMLSPEINEDKIITSIDVERNPVKSSQELLTKVPGLIIGQHAGGGKAEQIFYRGFDIDHGTDLQVNVDGMPVNMVSHAHGQGYADLHFVIPETVDKIDFKAGPYHFSQGNFATTGTVNLKSKENLDHNLIKLEGGQFNTKRLLFMNTFLDKTDESAYVAIENLNSDGPFESPQNFKRFNINSKYFKTYNNTKLEFSFSHFVSSWNASGQIPQRAVDNGSITRFGAIDDAEGGETSRTNVSLRMIQKYDDNSQMKHFAYYSKYNFDLYSNFTFFLNNEDDGDQIYQSEGRDIFGYNSDYQKEIIWGNTEVVINGGVGLRTDMVGNNQLSETKNKSEILERLRYGDVNETNYFGYASAAFQFNKWSVNPSLRLDYVFFGYQDFLEDNNTTGFKLKEQSAAILSPRLSVSYTPNNSFQSYFKVGQGFHTNDSRLIITSQANAIPKAYSTDAGFVWKTTPKLLLGLDLWAMLSEQEFVYVGDAGIVEPNGASVRQGVSFNTRYQPIKALFVNFDANYTHARFRDEPSGQDYVPLAPYFTLKGGVSYKKDLGFYAGINALHIKDRPANEDNSIVAEGYTVTNLNMGYIWEKFELGVQIQNLFDVEWNETQFATESRLANEPSGSSVEEIHFTPGTPFFVKGTIAYKF
ncbi:TonB-dependent receptor [Wenyingzhuangia marina]|uniref:Outer membrane receptor proteins, mostly Fe transport n=1 Tax=Wenyingzhuangia marina TaxID=1195760 RepID=A0A1M5SLM7_9FLAO|nr:TonB-dependent receptor [Wenyingzhuangia marina]GGF62922.1 TonB-dependent receptor [Wenyingzhuangia marina]SHH39462.1 Outer membrane receptor proteins, mostly Fe transport [Wenyingzhuangia marina]